jgi:hypothetical protein
LPVVPAARRAPPIDTRALIPVLIAGVVVMTNVAALVPGRRASRVSTIDLVAKR